MKFFLFHIIFFAPALIEEISASAAVLKAKTFDIFKDERVSLLNDSKQDEEGTERFNQVIENNQSEENINEFDEPPSFLIGNPLEASSPQVFNDQDNPEDDGAVRDIIISGGTDWGDMFIQFREGCHQGYKNFVQSIIFCGPNPSSINDQIWLIIALSIGLVISLALLILYFRYDHGSFIL